MYYFVCHIVLFSKLHSVRNVEVCILDKLNGLLTHCNCLHARPVGAVRVPSLYHNAHTERIEARWDNVYGLEDVMTMMPR